jgi:hypothetical protein
MRTVYFLLDCNHKNVGNPMGYKSEPAARAVANNPKSKAYAAIKQAWKAKAAKLAFLGNRYQNYENCYCIETFNVLEG